MLVKIVFLHKKLKRALSFADTCFNFCFVSPSSLLSLIEGDVVSLPLFSCLTVILLNQGILSYYDVMPSVNG